MNKEQVMNNQTLTDEQKERLESYFTMQKNLHKPQVIAANTEEEVIAFADSLIKKYNKRKEREQKAKEKKALSNASNKEIMEVVTTARQYISDEEIKQAIESAYKEKYNNKLQQQIAELQAKLL